MAAERSSARRRRSSPSCGKKVFWRNDPLASVTSDPGIGAGAQAAAPAAGSGELGAPLYIAWQVTNECNLACLHCIEESGPGKAFRDELGKEEVFRFLEHAMDLEI